MSPVLACGFFTTEPPGPADTIDYVMIHELAHLKELNHSANFWKIVEKFCPEYRMLRSKLNAFSRALPQL